MPLVYGTDADGNPISWWEDDASDTPSTPGGTGSVPGYSFDWANGTYTDSAGDTYSLSDGSLVSGIQNGSSGSSGSSVGGLGNLLKSLFGLGGASALSGAANSLIDRQSAKEAIEQQERQSLRSTALQESTLDPYRQQMAQGRAATKLDLAANAKYSPRSVSVPGAMAKYMPNIGGGFSYERSPETTAGLAALLRSVLSGETAPTMTDAANYGKTGYNNNLLTSSASTGRTGDPSLGLWPGERGDELTPSVLGAEGVTLRSGGDRRQNAQRTKDEIEREWQRRQRAMGVTSF